MSTFNPPIKGRTTEQLLQIASASEEWNVDALEQAKIELKLRNIPDEEIDLRKHFNNREKQLEQLKKANESYSVLDFLIRPTGTFLQIMIYWELEKDGYTRKANQQKWLRPIFILLIIGIIITISLIS